MSEEQQVSVEDLHSRLVVIEKEMIPSLKEDVEALKHGLNDNTYITRDIHGKHAEMYEYFVVAKNGIRVVSKIGDGVMYLADRGHKIGRGAAGVAILFGMAWAIAKGKLPEWVEWIVKVL